VKDPLFLFCRSQIYQTIVFDPTKKASQSLKDKGLRLERKGG
jgi:hypothetical protein